MKMKNTVILILTVLTAIWICGCGGSQKTSDVSGALLDAQEPKIDWRTLPRPSGGLTLSVDSESITADEVINPVRQQLGEMAGQMDYESFRNRVKPLLGTVLVQKVGDIRLYERAKAALPENIDEDIINKIIEQEVQIFIARYGGDYAAAEKVLKSMGTTWKDFYQFQRRAMLVQSFVSTEIRDEKPVTHSELLEYYNRMKGEYFTTEGLLEFRVIEIEAAKFADANSSIADAEQKAKSLAAMVSEKIKKGDDFGELAKQYSNDPAAKNGGLWKPIRPGSLAEPYDAIEKAAENLDIGQVSEPVAEGGHIFIVKLENKQVSSCKPFEEVQGDVESRMMYEKRRKRVDNMMEKIMSQVDLSYAEGFLEYCTQKAWRDWQMSG